VNFAEQAVMFPCGDESLVGILTAPQAPFETGVLVVVGGPQYRAGSHRQFVLLARHLAAHGFTVLRFDCRGMGDSTGSPRSFEALSEDIDAAIDALQHRAPRVSRVVLWGLCDGASAALLYCHDRHDARIAGLCLLNPWLRSDTSLARTHVKHYYLRRMREREFWSKLLRGQVGPGALAGLLRNMRSAFGSARLPAAMPIPFQQRMAQAWNSFEHGILLLLSGEDYTAMEFLECADRDVAWRTALEHPRLQRRNMSGADHTFSRSEDRARVEAHTLTWLEALPEQRKQA
jgi:exosortase A-associated hydrolase 1